jgi:hypothetical protein
MAQIHVFFQPNGTIVRNDPEAVQAGEQIEWWFHSLRPEIRSVRIQFEGKEARYFPTPAGVMTSLDKDLNKARFVWGTAPDSGNGHARGDKYSILAFDAKGGQIDDACIDPTIITEPPRP